MPHPRVALIGPKSYGHIRIQLDTKKIMGIADFRQAGKIFGRTEML